MNVVTCDSCGLRQWIPVSGVCRRCAARVFIAVHIPIQSWEASSGSDEPNVALGRVLRSMRLRRGQTQAQIALSAVTSRSHLARIELGAAQPNLSTLIRILRALQVRSVCFL